jgi:hypothetical protein
MHASMNVKLSAATEVDLLVAIEWRDGISHGLGDQFEIEFLMHLRVSNRLQRHSRLTIPDSVHADLSGLLLCFTPVLYFRIDGDSIVIVGLFTSGEDESDLQYREQNERS